MPHRWMQAKSGKSKFTVQPKPDYILGKTSFWETDDTLVGQGNPYDNELKARVIVLKLSCYIHVIYRTSSQIN